MNDFIPPAKPLIGDEERAAVDRVLRSGMLAQGPEVRPSSRSSPSTSVSVAPAWR